MIFFKAHISLIVACELTQLEKKRQLKKITWVKFAAFWLVSQERRWTNNRCSKKKNSRGFLRYTIELQFIFFLIFIKKVINGGHRDLDSVLISEFDFSTFAANAWKKVSFWKLYDKVFISILLKINNTRKYFQTKLILIFCSRWVDFYYNMGAETSVNLEDGALLNQ